MMIFFWEILIRLSSTFDWSTHWYSLYGGQVEAVIFQNNRPPSKILQCCVAPLNNRVQCRREYDAIFPRDKCIRLFCINLRHNMNPLWSYSYSVIFPLLFCLENYLKSRLHETLKKFFIFSCHKELYPRYYPILTIMVSCHTKSWHKTISNIVKAIFETSRPIWIDTKASGIKQDMLWKALCHSMNAYIWCCSPGP